jgi:anti-anti-sigma factor
MSHPHCFLRGEARGDIFAIHFEGEEVPLDEAHTEAFAGELSGLAQETDRPELLVDLGNVVAVSTPALVVLVKLRRQLLAGGRRLTLCNLRPGVAEVLEISRLSRFFTIRRDQRAWPPPADHRPGAHAGSAQEQDKTCAVDAVPAALVGQVPDSSLGSRALVPVRNPEDLVGVD